MLDVAQYLVKYKKLKPGSKEYKEFIDKLESLGVTGIPLPSHKMPKFTPRYYTSQFIEERQDEIGEQALKINLAVAVQSLILKSSGEKLQFEVVDGSLADEYLKTIETEFESIDRKTLEKLYTDLTRKPRKRDSTSAENEQSDEL